MPDSPAPVSLLPTHSAPAMGQALDFPGFQPGQAQLHWDRHIAFHSSLGQAHSASGAANIAHGLHDGLVVGIAGQFADECAIDLENVKSRLLRSQLAAITESLYYLPQ